MVDDRDRVGKISDIPSGWMPVVAGALRGEDGRWLMHRRPDHKHHGGLWEFPGGKVEPTEIPVESLVRELEEELGVIVRGDDCEAIAFADEYRSTRDRPIVILLYKVARFTGKPLAREGGAVGWFTDHEIAALDKPPLDVVLAARLFGDG